MASEATVRMLEMESTAICIIIILSESVFGK